MPSTSVVLTAAELVATCISRVGKGIRQSIDIGKGGIHGNSTQTILLAHHNHTIPRVCCTQGKLPLFNHDGGWCMNNDKQIESVRGQCYHIVVAGELDPSWSAWLGDLEIARSQSREDEPLTILSGIIPDQVALRGILNKIWDLRLILVSVTREQGRLGYIFKEVEHE